ncbi:penicillin-binding transpeptidase domain-containing protein [Streptomyces sp. NPDC087917]|uniref:penicillin-binding transpeptidase domain-containing protein n=1 Tax=Streptomyces sp. NPDC087917 TaxID=3155060 RepID=UPI00343BD704
MQISVRSTGFAFTVLAALLVTCASSGCSTDRDPAAVASPTDKPKKAADAKPRPPKLDGSLGDILVAGRPVTGSERSGHPVVPFKRTYTDGELYAAVTSYRSMPWGTTGLESIFDEDIKAGKDVVTTIDPAVQRAAYDGLRGQIGAAVAMDAQTGDILGLVSTPSFDPGSFSGNTMADQRAWVAIKDLPENPLKNRAIRSVENPGSAIHVLVAAAALDKGLLTSVDTPTRSAAVYAAPDSSTQFTGDPAHCTNATLRAALRYDCSNVFARIAADLGAEALASTAGSYGFNDDRIETPVRTFENTWPKKPENATQLAMMANGLFEVKTTPLQMAVITAMFTNGGSRVHPNLVVDSKTALSPQRMVTQRTADQLHSALGDSFGAWVPSASLTWSLSSTRTADGRQVAIAVYISAATDSSPLAGHIVQRISAAARK